MKKSKLSKSKHKRQATNISEVEPVKEKVIETKPNLLKLLSWAKNISNHIHLYKPSIDDNKQYHFYRIVIEKLRDIEVSSIRRSNFIQFACSLYDVSKETAVGKTYFSQMIQLETRAMESPSVHCSKSLYVYTAMENIVMKVDIWRLEADKNRTGQDYMARRFYLGNFEVDLTLSNETGKRSKKISTQQQNRFIHFQQENHDQNDQNRSKHRYEHTTVVYQTMNTHSLSYLQIFVPPEVICDQNDQILGIKNGRISDNGEIISDQRSSLRFHVQDILIPRSIIKSIGIEAEQLVMKIHEVIGLPSHNLKQLIMHLEFHNGWKSVCQQVLVLKEKEKDVNQMSTSRMGIQNKSTMKKSVKFRDTNNFSQNLNYHFDKMKQLNAVFLQEGGIFLIWLEGKFQVKYQLNEKGTKQQKNSMIYLPVAFALKTLDNMEDQKVEKFELVQGNPYNLGHVTQYLTALKQNKKADYDNSTNKIFCQLMFYMIKSKGGVDTIGKDNIEKGTQDIESLKAEKQRLVRVHRKIREQKRKKLIQMNQEIPFLDPTKLKEELYEKKIQKIKSQKQEKQSILLFLKARVNQLERQALASNYKVQQNQDMDNSTIKLVQKMPELFIDYKPEQPKDSRLDGIVLNIFNPVYCRKLQKPASLCQKSLIAEFMATKTYLNVRLRGFTPIRSEFKQYHLIVRDFDGNYIRIKGITSNYKQEDFKSVNIPIPNQDPDVTASILNCLLNGFMPFYLQCDNFKKLTGLALIDLGQLFQKASSWGMHSAQIEKKVVFTQQENEIAELELALSFSQTYSEEKLNDIEQNISQNISELITNKKEFNMLTRIKKYKQQRNNIEIPVQKEQAIKKALSSLSMEKIKIRCVRDKPEVLKLKVRSLNSQSKNLVVKITDEDEKYLQKPELSIMYKSVNISDHLVQFKTKEIFELKPNQQQLLLLLEYYTIRKVVDSQLSSHNFDNNIKEYNHPHKIVVTLTQPETHIVWQIFEIQVIPKHEPNVLTMEIFSQGKKDAILPIPCSNVTVERNQHEIKLMPTKAIVSLPSISITEWMLSQFTLAKSVPNQRQKIAFQHVELYVWGSAQQGIDGRLWQEEDLLLKVPLSEILKREMEFSYTIDSLTVYSKHVDLKVKSNYGFSYQSHMTYSRKSNDIFIRAKIHCHSIGQLTYPVQVVDQLGTVVYRIAVLANIQFPTLSTHQVFNIKIPNDHLDQSESFSYENHTNETTTFTTRALRPQLLRITQQKFDVRSRDAVTLHLKFNWRRIMQEIKEEDKLECQLIVGVTSGQSMDYFLFRCRPK